MVYISQKPNWECRPELANTLQTLTFLDLFSNSQPPPHTKREEGPATLFVLCVFGLFPTTNYAWGNCIGDLPHGCMFPIYVLEIATLSVLFL